MFYFFLENEIDGYTISLMEEIPEFIPNIYSVKIKIKKMLEDLTSREFKIKVRNFFGY